MTRVLVTGATGFVGTILCEVLARADYKVRAALRTARAVPAAIAEKVIVGDINSTTDWTQALDGVDAVIHAAARSHVLHPAQGSANLYFETNERGTERLANESAKVRVRRFVYLSSIKANGEETREGAYTPGDEPHPQDDYGLSKWHAEQHVAAAAGASGMQAVIVRPPLVYGPGVQANFLRLLRLVHQGWPLPFGAVRNARSLASVWNLCDFLLLLLIHPKAPGRTWMICDGEDLSTPELIRRLGHAMERQVRLPSVPVALLQLCAGLLGRRAELARLCGSLQVDISQSRAELGWSPPVTVNESLARTVAWYLAAGRSS
jgi:nucleoside-diphosphate-sugar epimerase